MRNALRRGQEKLEDRDILAGPLPQHK